ncbi:MAG: CBS domain-containing protein [Chloroflexota bacterium]
MNVLEIMTRNPATIRPSNTVREALEVMEELGCHHLPVLSTDEHLIGIVTARDCRLALSLPDVVREYWQEDELAARLPVRSIMTAAPTVTTPDTSVKNAARLMLKDYVSCLPVMREETLVGIITVSDILVAFTKMEQNAEDDSRNPLM